MQRLDGVFAEREVLPRRGHQVHQLGIASHSSGSSRVAKDLISRFDSSRSTSRSDRLLPSMRVEKPMLSMVATRRRAHRRSGASAPQVRQAPLNSPILVMRLRVSGMIGMVSVRSVNQIAHPFTPNLARIESCRKGPALLQTLANSLGRRPGGKSFASTKNDGPPAGVSAKPPCRSRYESRDQGGW